MRPKAIVVIASTTPVSGPCLDATQTASLYRVANRPIVCHVLGDLTASGIEQIAVLAPPAIIVEVRRAIERDGRARAEVCYLAHDSRADPEAALAAAARFASGSPIVLHRAEGLLGQPLGAFTDLLSGSEPDAVLLVTQGGRTVEPLRSATQRALRLVEIDPAKAAFGLAGVVLLSPGLLEAICHSAACPSSMHLSALAETIVTHGVPRPQVRVVGCWRAFTGNPLDLLDINRAVLDRLEVSAHAPARPGSTIEGRVLIDPSANVAASVISGPVIIGGGARISNSYIGPHTAIGARVCIEGAEIERSIVLCGASILHIGGRLVTSVVGREARIFRDFSVPRAMRMRVGDGDEVALC